MGLSGPWCEVLVVRVVRGWCLQRRTHQACKLVERAAEVPTTAHEGEPVAVGESKLASSMGVMR